jgi:hypothetical protein
MVPLRPQTTNCLLDRSRDSGLGSVAAFLLLLPLLRNREPPFDVGIILVRTSGQIVLFALGYGAFLTVATD